MPWRVLIAAGVLWVAGCAQDPLARYDVYWGLSPFDPPSGPLVEVLDTDPDTPAKQGLLYTAMRDAELASTYADRALTRLDEPGETESALGELIYAIEPAEAPDWGPKGQGPGPGWEAKGYGVALGLGSQGYGLRRALGGMADEIAAAIDGDPAALRGVDPGVLGCIEDTQDRAAQTLALSQQLLAGGGGSDPEPALRRNKELADTLNHGVPAPGTGGCGLQEVERQLNQAVPGERTS